MLAPSSRSSPVRAGHRPYSRATLRRGTGASTPDHRCLSRKRNSRPKCPRAWKAAVRRQRLGHSRALRRSVETRCRVTPKRSAICSIVMPSAYSACASARRTFAPLVSSAFELSVSSWTMSVSSPETSSVYDAPFERERRSWAIRFLIRLARLPLSARTSSSVLRASRNSSSSSANWLRSVATIRKAPTGQLLLQQLGLQQSLLPQRLLQQCLLRAIVPAVLDVRVVSGDVPVHLDEILPAPSHRKGTRMAPVTRLAVSATEADASPRGQETATRDRCGAPSTARLR